MVAPSDRKLRQGGPAWPSSILLACVLALLLGVQSAHSAALAAAPQQSGDWAPPSLVFAPEYAVADQGYAVVTDSSGRLHLFFSYVALEEDGEPLPEYPHNTVLYVHSDDGTVWSEPVDIFIPDAPKRWQGAGIDTAVDSNGVIHLVSGGGPNAGGGPFQYVRAHASVADDARFWQEPNSGVWGMQVTKAVIQVDQADRVHIVYSQRPGDVYLRSSTDHGETWSEDYRVSTIDPRDSAPDDVAVAVDSQGRIHVAWSENEMPGGYPPIGVFHAHSDDGEWTWSNPRQIGGQYSSRMAIAVIEPWEVHMVWGTSVQDRGRYTAASLDGGDTWTVPHQVGVPGFVGGDTGQTVNPEQLVTDSSGTLHWFMASDFADAYSHRGTDGQWTRPVVVTLPPAQGWTKDPHFSGNKPVIVGGNQLHLIVREGARKQQNENDRYWHTVKALDAPAIPLKPVPDVTPTRVATAEVVRWPDAPSPVAITALQVNSTIIPATRASPGLAIAVGILPAAVLVAVVAGFRLKKKRQAR